MKKHRLPVEIMIAMVKFSCFHLFLVMLTFGVSVAGDGFAQEMLMRPVTVTLVNQNVRTALTRIGKSARVKFSYEPALLQKSGNVSITVQSEPLATVLDRLLKPLGIQYNPAGKYIILTRDPGQGLRKPEGMEDSEAMEKWVTGKVSDETGAALPGVSILVKGTQTGTTTQADGTFKIDVGNEPASLIFSFVGYVPQEIEVGGRTAIDVALKVDTKALEEVVVTGYGTQKRSDLTGSVSTVKANDIKNLPVRSVNEALQGRAAGVQVTRNDGSPGANSDIIIRGAGSIGGMAPLYIVDGIRMSAGNNFNLQDVESIEILKDASAAAIYGAQAAGGVVLVTTKRGTSMDKMSVNLNAYFGVKKPVNLYKLLNTNDYYNAKTAFGVATAGWGDPAALPNTNWTDALFSNGTEQSYSLDLSGASAKSNYYISANYQKEGGTIIDNWFKRYGLRTNSDYKLNSKLKVGETMYAWMTEINPTVSTTFPFRSAPVVGIYDPTNAYGGWAKTGSFFGGPNLLGQEYQNHMSNQTYAVEGNVYADWQIIPALSFRATFGASVYNAKNLRFTEAFDFGIVANRIAFLGRDINNQRNLTANFVLTYAKTFGKHEIKALAGYEAYKSDLSTLHGEAQGFPYVTYNLGLTTNPGSYVTNGAELPQTRLLSQFGRINYTYSGKYLLTGTVRRDGSDRFGPANKWGVFPSASVGWKLSEEASLQDNLHAVSNLKLRASYGKLGSTSNIPQYTYQSSYGGNGGTNAMGLFDGSRSKGYALTAQLVNENIKWESVLQTDVGVDVGLFRNALNITFDWYSRQTQGMIYQVPVAPTAGFGNTSVYTNIGQMSNKGIELAADYRGQKGDFTYSVAVNAAFNKNLVKQLDGNNNNPISDGAAGNDLDGNAGRTQIGNPMSQFYGYQVDGIFQRNDEVQALNESAQQAAGSTTIFYQNAGTAAGDLRFRDVNGDGRITTLDKTFIGNPWPKLTYGLTLNLGWKGLELTALLQGIQGVDVYNGNKYYTEYFYGDYTSTRDIFNSSFFNGNGLTDQPRIGAANASGAFARDPNSNYGRISSYFVEDGSFLKLRNLQIGYTLPGHLLKALHMQGLRIYAQGQNLFTITKYSGLDPEVLGRNGTTARGIDTIFSYPRSMLLSMGLNLSF